MTENRGAPELYGLLGLLLIILALLGFGIVLFTAPLTRLLGNSRYALEGALHGVAAGLFMITATIGLFQAYRLLTGTIQHSGQLEFGSLFNALLAFLTIFFGVMRRQFPSVADYGLVVLLVTAGVFLSILTHELGHALVARRFGFYADEIRIGGFYGLAILSGPPARRSCFSTIWGATFFSGLSGHGL